MDTAPTVFPQAIRWEGDGTSRVPFMAYTDADLHRKRARALLLSPALVLRRPRGRDPEAGRLQAHGGRRALGDPGARRRRRHQRRRERLRPSRHAASAASATAIAGRELHLPVPPVELLAEGRPAGRAVPSRRQAGRQGQRRHAGRLQAGRPRPQRSSRSRRAAASSSRRSTTTSSRSRTSWARRSCGYFDRLFDGRKLTLLGYNRQRIPGNWKLMQENIKDPYHPGLLHTWFVTFGLWRADNKSRAARWTRTIATPR